MFLRDNPQFQESLNDYMEANSTTLKTIKQGSANEEETIPTSLNDNTVRKVTSPRKITPVKDFNKTTAVSFKDKPSSFPDVVEGERAKSKIRAHYPNPPSSGVTE